MNTFETFLNSKRGRKQSRAAWAVEFQITSSYVAHLVSGLRQPSLATAYQIEQATEGRVSMQSWIEDLTDAKVPVETPEASVS